MILRFKSHLVLFKKKNYNLSVSDVVESLFNVIPGYTEILVNDRINPDMIFVFGETYLLIDEEEVHQLREGTTMAQRFAELCEQALKRADSFTVV